MTTDRFRASVHIVDDTYWDDGSRWTARHHEFATLGEAVEFKRRTVEEGSYKTVSQVTGESLDRYVDEDDITLARHVDGQWFSIAKPDVISLLGEIASD